MRCVRHIEDLCSDLISMRSEDLLMKDEWIQEIPMERFARFQEILLMMNFSFHLTEFLVHWNFRFEMN